MAKKDKIEIALEFLFTLLCAIGIGMVYHEGLNFVFPLSLLFFWSIALMWTSWKHISGRYAPKLNKQEEAADIVDELAFNMPSSRNLFLRQTLFSPGAARIKTWSYIFLIIYLAFFAVNGYALNFTLVLLSVQTALFGYSAYLNYNTFCKKYKDYKAANLLFVFNKNGMLGAIPRLSNEKGQNMVYIYTAFTDWNDIQEIVFYKTHIEVNYSKYLREFLIADNDEQMAQFKKMVNTYYRQPHTRKRMLNLQNYPHILKNLYKPAIGISTEEGDSFQLGESYIAPIPSVPKNFKWPQNHKLPLSFLAQINCKDLAPYDTEELLPKTGILYFFYEMKEMLLNEQGNQGCARVVYSNVPNDQLFFHKESTKFINPAYLLRQRKLRFHGRNVMPDYTEACQLDQSVAISNAETYNYACWCFKRNQKKEQKKHDEMMQLFGYPAYHTKNDIGIEKDKDMVLLMQLTLTKKDFYAYYQSMSDYSDRGIQFRKYFDQWDELPCQLYYFIPRNDLKRLDFSNIYFARRGKNIDDFVLPDDISGKPAN